MSPKLRKHYKSNGYFAPGSANIIKVLVIFAPALLSSATAIQSTIAVWRRRSGYSSGSSTVLFLELLLVLLLQGFLLFSAGRFLQ